MILKFGFLTIVLLFGICLGFFIQNNFKNNVIAHGNETIADSEKILVVGHGRAITGKDPNDAEKFKFAPNNKMGEYFDVVPKGKKLIITDVIYIPQRSVKQNGVAINLNNGYGILFQALVSPNDGGDIHLCTGYGIESGRSLYAYTDGTSTPGQYISISVTGYLTNE
ncbi:MAG TPA: hypothetical protein VGB02_10120 [Pyrinomonadaceae bacterium]|jgi:hypothetical protein